MDPHPTTCPAPTAFDRAWEQYRDALRNRPKKAKQEDFIDRCSALGASSPEVLNDLLRRTHSDKRSQLDTQAAQLFGRIADALKDYSEVVGQLASVQPMPLAIIWGSLKLVMDGVTRCRDLFEIMEDELRTVATQIERLKKYKALYGQSDSMQELFFRSYTNMIRFWHRVHKECGQRSKTAIVLRSLTSDSTNKLKKIVNDLKNDVHAIAEEASLCQAAQVKEEHDAAREERDHAARARTQHDEWQLERRAVDQLAVCQLIRNHLGFESSEAWRANETRRAYIAKAHHDGTCRWLHLDARFTAWQQAASPESAILCLRGPSGCGKTTLTSYAIDHLRHFSPSVYYFCQFSQPCDNPQTLLKLLAAQLFNAFFSQAHPVSEDLGKQVLASTTAEQLQNLISELVRRLGGAHFFIDGLDEAHGATQIHVLAMVHFLIDLCERSGGRVKLWCSVLSGMRPLEYYSPITQRCEHVRMIIDVTEQTQPDVEQYLASRIDALRGTLARDTEDGLSDEDEAVIREAEDTLLSRAQGNFLWAHLMTEDFSRDNRPRSVSELRRHVSAAGTKEHADIYRKHFEERIGPTHRDIASKVMAIIAFARRHLSAEEVRQAVIALLMHSKKKAVQEIRRLTAHAFLHRFAVHIQIDCGDSGAIDWSSTCRLDHASVLGFLDQDRPLWADTPHLRVSPRTIASACLSYMGHSVYSSPLIKHVQLDGSVFWSDAHGTGMDNSVHCFAPYAVKYWARHLEHTAFGDDNVIRHRVEAFVASTNFQTLLQIQTLWVEGQFSVYAVEGRPSVLRVLPDWLVRVPNRRRFAATKPWLDYNILHHNWSRLLDCDGCHYEDHDCAVRPYRGEIDRIWWGSLGSEHMFSSFRARYPSFSLVQPIPGAPLASGNRYEAIVVYESIVHVLRFSSQSQDGDNITFVCERWAFDGVGSPPNLLTQQALSTTKSTSSWSLYTKPAGDPGALCASPTAFSENGRLLRISAQLFYLDPSDHYRPLTPLSAQTAAFPPYIDDVAGCNDIVALVSRSHSAAERILADDANTASMDLNLTLLELRASTDYRQVDVDDTPDWESSSSSSDCGALESWSEGSTEDEAVLLSDNESSDALETDRGIPDRDDSTSETSSVAGQSAEEVSDDSEPPTPLHATSLPQFRDLDSDDEELFWANEMKAQLRAPLSYKSRFSRSGRPSFGRSAESSDSSDDEGPPAAYGAHGPALHNGEAALMSLTVLRMGENGEVTTIFYYRHRLAIMLYESPPIVHPHAPLVVWALGAGEILFADYVANTFFVRKLRSSAPLTRHLSVKLHFSPCGKFLHIASLEAQICKLVRRYYDRSGNVVKDSTEALRLHVFVSTYRLSARKMTRSPPSLIHHAKAFLGTRVTVNPLQLPCTFTWTQHALFVTLRDADLTVYNIPLFRAADAAQRGVLVPSEKVFLPDNAPYRAVFFSPGTETGQPFIVLGSEPREPTNDDALFATATHRGVLAPPICCLLEEKRDLGKWVLANGVRMPIPHGVGKLDQRREKFDPQDDCDVAPYIRFV